MGAPALKRSTDEIVAEIMGILEAPTTEVFVRRLIDDLRAECPPFAGNRRTNNEYLGDLRKWIVGLKRKLQGAPEPLKAALFSPELFWSLFEQSGTSLGINPRTRDYLAQLKPARLDVLIAALDFLQRQCELTIRSNLGTHGRVSTQKIHAANASRSVIHEADTLHPGKRRSVSCSPTSDYCQIASLFFEAATGKHDDDLRHACEIVAPASLRTKS